MIPNFPKFKNLESTDKFEIEKFTKAFKPYSDFNFISLWAWDVYCAIKIAKLNNNLVIRFIDYLSTEPFYSFIGNTQVSDTVNKLLNHSKNEGILPKLKLVPEQSIENLKANFQITEDRDNFDYILDTEKLSNLTGPEFHKKRSEINRLLRDHKLETKIINIYNENIRIQIQDLNYKWLEEKKRKDPFFNIKNELIAIEKLLNLQLDCILSIGIFLNNELIAYSINEVSDGIYGTGHFYKASKYSGLFDYLIKQSSELLLKNGTLLLNFEQDLGLMGLRTSKLSFRPSIMLKKYIIEPI